MTTRVAERPLENYANNSSLPVGQIASDLRKRRYLARSYLWHETSLPRLRNCGRAETSTANGVTVRERAGVAGFAGLQTCGSVWADPVCSSKVMARRRVEIGAAVEIWQARGGRVGFVTLTMRHRKGQRLSTLWDGLSKAWGRVTSGVRWTKDRQVFGVAGWLRVVEVTYGRNGWHVHVHSLIFFQPSTVEPDAAALHASMFGRWAAGLRSAGLSQPLMVGQDSRLIEGAADVGLAQYFTKAVHGGDRIAYEFTGSQTKAVRGALGTRPVWSLLDEVIDSGDADSLDLWHEYEKGSKGRRQMTWAQGLRRELGMLVEQTDEEIADEELGSDDDDLVTITSSGWKRVVELLLMVPILEAAETNGLRGVRELLDREGVDYRLIGEAS